MSKIEATVALEMMLERIRFFHFTPIDNLSSILEDGLLPLSGLDDFGITAVRFDRNRFDHRVFDDGAICLSVGHPNVSMGRAAKKHELVVLEIDSKIWFQAGERFSSPTNAASNLVTDEAVVSRVIDNDDFEFRKSEFGIFTLFSDPVDVIFASGFRKQYDRAHLRLKPGMPADPQSEVLINFPIRPTSILRVYCEDHETKKALSKEGFLREHNVIVKPRYFKPRADAKYWYGRQVDSLLATRRVREIFGI